MKKERYFTPETLRTKSQEFLATVASLRQRHVEINFQPGRAALLVLDLQEYFLREESHAYIPSAPACLSGILKMVDSFIRTDRPVIATRHINTPQDAGMMSKWWRDTIAPGSAYSQNIASINHPKLIYLEKSQYDAFLQTSLDKILRERGVTQVVISGVMTHLCCETTARSAFMRGYEVFFTVDGTATYNEELHRASLLTLSHGFAIPVLVEDLVCYLESDET
jgi:isochorismate hydrolase